MERRFIIFSHRDGTRSLCELHQLSPSAPEWPAMTTVPAPAIARAKARAKRRRARRRMDPAILIGIALILALTLALFLLPEPDGLWKDGLWTQEAGKTSPPTRLLWAVEEGEEEQGHFAPALSGTQSSAIFTKNKV